MDKLPNEMIKYIISFIDFMPKYLCKKTLHKAIDNNIELSKVNSLFNKSLSDKRQDFKRLYELACKYYRYEISDKELQECIDNDGYIQYIDSKVKYYPPYLLDAVSSGIELPCCTRSISVCGEDIIQDIRDLMRLIPIRDSLLCRMGTLRCRSELSVFVMASSNMYMDISIIEELLEVVMTEGLTDSFVVKLINSKKVNVVDDLYKNGHYERSNEIKELIENKKMNNFNHTFLNTNKFNSKSIY